MTSATRAAIRATTCRPWPNTSRWPSIALENWFGLFAPAGTPDAVVQKLNAAVTTALKDPELAKKMREQGGEPTPMTPAQFKDFIKTGVHAQFERIVTTAKIVAE